MDGAVPYSILAFRLETGEDKKDCLKVELQGEFIRSAPYKTINVKVISNHIMIHEFDDDADFICCD